MKYDGHASEFGRVSLFSEKDLSASVGFGNFEARIRVIDCFAFQAAGPDSVGIRCVLFKFKDQMDAAKTAREVRLTTCRHFTM
jgi:hypothetical protein